jgi:hypothetical protein
MQGIFSRSSNFLGLKYFLDLSAMATVLSGPRFLFCPLFCLFCLLEFSQLSWSGNLSHVLSSATIVFSTTRLNSSLFRGFSLQKS